MTEPPAGGTGAQGFYDDPRGVTARARMFNEVRSQMGHELFTANSLLDLVAELERGAGNMVADDELTDRDLDRSVKATHEFLDTMASVRSELGAPSFTEETVSKSHWRLCPGFWPFC